MTDRDVIWVYTPKDDWGEWDRRAGSLCAVEYIPLSRATQLQRAMTVIAEQLTTDEMSKTAIVDTRLRYDAIIEHARKALTEFERTE